MKNPKQWCLKIFGINVNNMVFYNKKHRYCGDKYVSLIAKLDA